MPTKYNNRSPCACIERGDKFDNVVEALVMQLWYDLRSTHAYASIYSQGPTCQNLPFVWFTKCCLGIRTSQQSNIVLILPSLECQVLLEIFKVEWVCHSPENWDVWCFWSYHYFSSLKVLLVYFCLDLLLRLFIVTIWYLSVCKFF